MANTFDCVLLWCLHRVLDYLDKGSVNRTEKLEGHLQRINGPVLFDGRVRAQRVGFICKSPQEVKKLVKLDKRFPDDDTQHIYTV